MAATGSQLCSHCTRGRGLFEVDRGVLGMRLEAPDDEVATAADIARADEIAWSMAIEDRKLTSRGYDKLLNTIISDRMAREQSAATL